jgi:hypothetical protein
VSGLGHRAINGELNRLTGIVRIDDATVEQLQRRAEHAKVWVEDPASFVVGRAPVSGPRTSPVRRPVVDLREPVAAEPESPEADAETADAGDPGARFAALRRALREG